MTHHFVNMSDLTPDETRSVFQLATSLKKEPVSGALRNRTLVMFFEKSSTRTRLSFEIGMTQLGGHAVYLDRDSSQLSRGESISDTARVISRYADLMMARVYAHSTVEDLARASDIPVINGLSDLEHPCQVLADIFTIEEFRGTVSDLKIAYVGDGNNNMTHSLLVGVTQLGGAIAIGAPRGYEPAQHYVNLAEQNAAQYGGSVMVTHSPHAAVADADVIITDVWVSMGREEESQERREALGPFQVNEGLVAGAAPDFLFMHCLPAHIGEEVTSEVAYGTNSVIFDEAENRLHVQKALMVYLLEASQGEK